jgi:site-specific recombinase XerD
MNFSQPNHKKTAVSIQSRYGLNDSLNPHSQMNTTNVAISTKTGNKKTSSLSINLRPRENQRGVTLYFRLNLNGIDVKPTDVSLGIKCQKSEIKNGRIKGKPEVDLLLSTYKANIERAYYRLLEKGQPIDLEVLKYAFKGNFIDGNPPVTLPTATVQSKIPLLFEAMDIYVQSNYTNVGTGKSPITKRKNINYFNVLKKWALHSFGRENIELSEIKHAHSQDIYNYVKGVRGNGNNNSMLYVQRVKSLFTYAISNDWISKNPFMDFKSKKEKSKIVFLSESEINKFESIQVSKGSTYELVRDLFTFSCYTGLSFMDLGNVSYSNIKESTDNIKYIQMERLKTDETAIIPLFNEASILIEKYRLNEFQDKMFTVPTNQCMNRTLKELAEIGGIKKKLTFRISRSTFGTMLVSKGVDMAIAQRALGHSSIQTTIRHYASVQPETVINSFKNSFKNL